MTSDQRKIIEGWIKLAVKAGWVVVPSTSASGKRHWKLRTPGGVTVILPGSPNGSPKGVLNTRAKLRRAGLKGI